MSTPTREPVSVILPIRPGTAGVEAAIAGWVGGLNAVGHPWELLVIDDGMGITAAGVEAKAKTVRVLAHETPRGFGAAVKTGLAAATHDLVAYSSLDYPYTPADLKRLLDRIVLASEMEDLTTGEIVMRTPDLVSGCRTGVPVPAVWGGVGMFYRLFCRFALGLPLEKLPGWYGFGEHLRAWRAWLVYGVPFDDPNAAFKLFRKTFAARFPIQSDGEFVHIELAAKCTFLNGILDEIPLTPSATPVPTAVWDRADRRPVFGSPQFWQPGTGGDILPTAG
jgi:hypothetical protein